MRASIAAWVLEADVPCFRPADKVFGSRRCLSRIPLCPDTKSGLDYRADSVCLEAVPRPFTYRCVHEIRSPHHHEPSPESRAGRGRCSRRFSSCDVPGATPKSSPGCLAGLRGCLAMGRASLFRCLDGTIRYCAPKRHRVSVSVSLAAGVRHRTYILATECGALLDVHAQRPPGVRGLPLFPGLFVIVCVTA